MTTRNKFYLTTTLKSCVRTLNPQNTTRALTEINRMKTILFLSVLFCAIALPAFGELTDADLNKIRLIFNEEIEKAIKPINADNVTLKTDVAWMQGKLENVDKQIPHAKYVLYGLIALTVVVVAAQLIPFVQEIRKDRLIEKQIEILIQEIETLKQQRIVNP